MNNKQRMQAIFKGIIPDKVPHFELDFQLCDKAFGRTKPSYESLINASEKEREYLYESIFEICELILDRYDWSALYFPLDYCGYFSGKLIPEAVKRFGSRTMIYDFNPHGTFWMPNGNEMVEFYAAFFEDPKATHELAEKKKNDSIELAKRQIDQGVDFICINSDYGYNGGPFLSPKMFSEFVTPYLAEIVDAIHKSGSKAILHSDGNLNEILSQLVSTEIDGWQSIDPQGHMDIAEVKRKYGDKLILMGNVQASLMQETNEELIRGSVRYAMNSAKAGGKFILSSSNCIFAGMPLESYHVMLDEYEKLAWY